MAFAISSCVLPALCSLMIRLRSSWAGGLPILGFVGLTCRTPLGLYLNRKETLGPSVACLNSQVPALSSPRAEYCKDSCESPHAASNSVSNDMSASLRLLRASRMILRKFGLFVALGASRLKMCSR